MTNENQIKTFKSHEIVLSKAQGVYIWDANGKKYLDFYGGHAVALTGHCHPHVVKAIKEQAEKAIFYSTYLYSDVRAEALEKIVQIAPQNNSKVFLCNSGTEANEAAIKMVRKFTGKKTIISMKNSFHGRTIGSLSATGIDHYRKQFKPLLTGYKFAKFGDIEDLEKLVDKNTAGIILEPIQSMGGVVTASKDYYQQLAELCEKQECPLIFDEVQTGFGRTGKMFACEHWNVEPKVITFAKGVASGIPMGGVLADSEIAETIQYGEHGCTFGGGQIACAAAKATIEVIENEKLVENSAKMEQLIKKKLIELAEIDEIKGMGLLLGLKTKENVKELVKKGMENGIIFSGSWDPEVARLLPPLIINEDHVEEFCQGLKRVFE